MRAGARIWRASASASRASGTAPGASPASTWQAAAHGELDGGVGEVAGGPGEPAACSARRAASANAPVVIAMFERVAQMASSTRQSRALHGARWRRSRGGTVPRRRVTSARFDANSCADRQGERVARDAAAAPGSSQSRLAVQQQGIGVPDLARREAGQDRERGVDVAGVDRPGPGREQVVLFRAEPDSPEHLGSRVVGMFSDRWRKLRVVVGVAGTPPLGLAGLVEAFLAVLADRLQQPVAGLGSVVLGDHQRPRHQAGQQLEHRVRDRYRPRRRPSSAASRVQPPANTASRPSSRCSGSASSSKDQSIVARRVW